MPPRAVIVAMEAEEPLLATLFGLGVEPCRRRIVGPVDQLVGVAEVER